MAKLNLRSNRKFARVALALRLDSRAHLLGHLETLWASSFENGTPLVGDFDDIELAADWPTSNEQKYGRGALAGALVLAGFLDVVAEGRLYAIHDWYDHSPEWLKKRISRELSRDATVGPATYYLGLIAWRRRAAAVGIEVDQFTDEPSTGGEFNVETANGSRNWQNGGPAADLRRTDGGRNGENGGLSSEVKGREGKRSSDTSPNPRSPLAPSPNNSDAEQLASLTARCALLAAALHSIAGDVLATIEEQMPQTGSLGDWSAYHDLLRDATDRAMPPSLEAIA